MSFQSKKNFLSPLSPYWKNYTHPSMPRYARTTHSPEEKPGNILKAVTFNIYYGENIENAVRLLRHPELQNADFILLQEKNHQDVKYIADHLNYNYLYYPSSYHTRKKLDFGNAVLSKWPLSEEIKIILPRSRQESMQRIVVGATALVGGKKVRVYSTHFSVFASARKRGKITLGLLDAVDTRYEHCIIGGDFNTFTACHRRILKRHLEKRGFVHASEKTGWTYILRPLLFRRLTLDHIYAKGFEVTDAGKVVDFSASDHLPVRVELKFKEAGS